ncbi:MAG TPA: S41 family peptidase [Niabella sp.]|nr:S41 family peptidase [Niabella sp.]HOZ96288.1 S41 family peptidase [Niabella sp.]HQW14638.1 S41 family peptidase [Niabella sp.]HQX19777.1 S41 family peptidase [Niabella sp.]HQX41123.1 S41 family peptidase [Niabella sp.]
MKNLFLSVSILLLVFSCAKEPADNPKNPIPNPPTGTSKTYQQLLADTLYKLAQQVYYWNTMLLDSASFNPLSYAQSDTMTGLSKELLTLARTPQNPNSAFKPFEQAIKYNSQGNAVDYNNEAKFSYLIKTSDLINGGKSSNIITNQSQITETKMTLDGKNSGLGFTVGLVRVSNTTGTSVSIPYLNKDSFVVFVRYVTNGSPASKAGLQRGDVIANAELNYNTNPSAISTALNSNSQKIIVYKPASKTRDTLPEITSGIYTFNPVFRDTLITVGDKRIGYIAYQSFTNSTNSNPELDLSFIKFANATDLVIDLRHNGGGYVSTAQYFMNLAAPQSASGEVGFVEHYTPTLVNKQAFILKTQPVFINNVKQNYTYYDVNYSQAGNTTKVNKRGSFNGDNSVKNIYFIVSSSTASASELLINSLKPFYNVYLIGARFSDFGYKTYGKPVGFFDLRLGKYTVFLVSFETKNKNGEGGYYDGITTNFQAFDDVKYNFGDPNESCFKLAIQKITGNPNYSPSASARSVYPVVIEAIPVGPVAQIHDMISTPVK